MGADNYGCNRNISNNRKRSAQSEELWHTQASESPGKRHGHNTKFDKAITFE